MHDLRLAPLATSSRDFVVIISTNASPTARVGLMGSAKVHAPGASGAMRAGGEACAFGSSGDADSLRNSETVCAELRDKTQGFGSDFMSAIEDARPVARMGTCLLRNHASRMPPDGDQIAGE